MSFAATPRDIGLPFDQWAPNQREAALLVAAALTDDDVDTVLLDAPTGTGKSLIALAASKLAEPGMSKTAPDSVQILTATKILQDQYVRSFHDWGLRDIRGRGNFKCEIDATLTAANAVCTVGQKCSYAEPSATGCAYYDQVREAFNARYRVSNYAWWFARSQTQMPPVGLLVLDEGHTLDDQLRNHLTRTIRVEDYIGIIDRFPTGNDQTSVEAWARWFHDHGPRIVQHYQEARIRFNKGQITLREFGKAWRIHSLRNDFNRATISDAAGTDQWVVVPLTKGKGWQLSPVWSAPYFKRFVSKHTSKLLVMSATILAPDVFAWTTGIDQDKLFYNPLPTPFPKENRPVVIQPAGRVKGKETWPTAIMEVIAIASRHAGQSGVVHTSNYLLAEEVSKALRKAGFSVWTHQNSGVRDSALDGFRSTPGSILVSPSMTTGVDLPGDLCRWQVVAKLPFPSLGDPQVKARMAAGPDGYPTPMSQTWYTWTTLCALIQAAGRGVRSVDDWCVTYIIDGNISWFLPSSKRMVPEWFRESILWNTAHVLRDSPTAKTRTDHIIDRFTNLA